LTLSLPAGALALILLSAVLHASWNAVLKSTEDKAAASALLGAVSVVAAGLVGGLIVGFHAPRTALPWVVACAAVEVFYFVTLAAALQRLPLGTGYGLSRGLGLLLVVPGALLLFGERLQPSELLGVGLLSAGLFALVQGASSRSGVVLAAVCGVTIAVYPLLYKRALAEGIDAFTLFTGSVGLSVPGQVAMLGAERRERLATSMRRHGRRIVLAGLLCCASFVLFLVVLREHGPGRLTALRNSSVLFASLISMLRGEERTLRDGLSALAVGAGCVLVA
jgi:drug/metabolite transporter (DMT)-like permease